MALVTLKEQEKLTQRITEYMKKLYPNISFEKKEEIFDRTKQAEVLYTYAGEESEVEAEDKIREISKALKHGYDTPILLLRTKRGDVLLDGHRRLKTAWEFGLQWKAIVLVPSEDREFGIEKHIIGKVRELWK
ncbi:hypothetical protein DRJ17_01880 [Candidatus Woesearchaeota archaeon]|nr:MAG: hypothetical protein DRJ17_01880 [Candidatus Woesearchaeota archaeon]